MDIFSQNKFLTTTKCFHVICHEKIKPETLVFFVFGFPIDQCKLSVETQCINVKVTTQTQKEN